ncbi:E3 ubiquitin-protein ligase MARCH4 [Denticeps clupeoides]|uniref:RING-type E3 ubiquitin transferase n=1 Tax=Denticeps clupeoides TaxID=299321 RepID=A0AAY4C8E2_9TELE|nr:E3 ubiquitin-protein ligase MARCH4 [Denticeps clupeoides]
MLKSRCCVLLGDLKLLFFRPPPPAPTPMIGQRAEPGVTEHGNNNTLVRAGPQAEAAAGTDASCDAFHFACSPDDFPKREERFSLISCTSGIRTPVCRICFQGPEQGELLSPCRCSGSVRSTHQPCLIKWISERGSWTCELCYYKYQVIAISTKNPLQWQAISLTVIEKVQIAAAILGSLFLIASISWLVWSSFSPSAKWQRQDLLFQICYGMYGFMDVVCIALIVHEGPSVFRIFHRWQAVNQQWKVLNYDKMKDTEDLKNGDREWTLSMLHQRAEAGPSASPSTSSIMAAVAATTPAAETPTVAATTTSSDAQNSATQGNAASEQHYAYNFLQLFSHLRQHEARGGQPSSTSRELVMRVTTV